MDKRNLVSAQENDNISRAMLMWLNEFPEKPVYAINYEYLPPDGTGMALSTVQEAYIIKKYMRGGYQGQYQFKIVYRAQPGNNSGRLQADEVLNAIGDWASARRDFPKIGEKKYIQRIQTNTRAAMFVRYDDGSEDHQILMTVDYVSI